MSMTEITAGHALSSQSNAYIATNNDKGAQSSHNLSGQQTQEADADQNQRSHVEMYAAPDGSRMVLEEKSLGKLNKSQVNVASITQQVDSSSSSEMPDQRVKSALSRNNNSKTQ